MPRQFLILVVSLLLAITVTMPAGMAETPGDEAAIREIWKSYSAARVAGDDRTWLSLWDENGIQMPPGMPARGKNVLDEVIPKAFSAGKVSSMVINPEEIVVAGDWAYTRGTYTSGRLVDGQAVNVDGKFITILKRQQDGGWKIYRDIFNSNAR